MNLDYDKPKRLFLYMTTLTDMKGIKKQKPRMLIKYKDIYAKY